MADSTALALRDDGSVTLQVDGSAALVDPTTGDCCCGYTCACTEADGVGSPNSYRLRIGPLVVNEMSCVLVRNEITEQDEFFSVEGTFDGLDLCMTADLLTNSYIGYAPVDIVVKKWFDICDGDPAVTSSMCAQASLTVDILSDTFVIVIELLDSPSTPDITSQNWTIAAGGPFPAHMLPPGWCVDGFTKPSIEPDLSFNGYSYDDKDWATLGGGTFTLNPCCTPQSECDEGI